MFINLEELSTPQVYFTMTQTILPRPIAWILSEHKNGDYNLAPFSYFNAVSSDPPLVMVSIGLQDDGTKKDTLANVMERPEFVVHIASCEHLPALNLSSATLPPGESEVTRGNLETEAFADYALPRLKAAKIALMCSVYTIQEIGNDSQTLLFGRIRNIYVQDTCTRVNAKGRLEILPDKIRPLSRLGANQYSTFGEVLFAKRPA